MATSNKQITFNELNNQYTLDEYRILLDTLPKDSVFSKRLQEYLDRKFIYTQKYQKAFIYKSFAQYAAQYGHFFHILYQVPFLELPMYVNKIDNLDLQAAFIWRMLVGR